MKKFLRRIILWSSISVFFFSVHSASANVLPYDGPSLIPHIFVTIDGSPVDSSFLFRTRRAIPGVKVDGSTSREFERKLTRCDDGICFVFPYTAEEQEVTRYNIERFPEQIPEEYIRSADDGGNVGKEFIKEEYYTNNKNSILASYDVTDQLRGKDLSSKYEIVINTEDGTIEIQENPSLESELADEFSKEYKVESTKAFGEMLVSLSPVFWIPLVLILGLLLGVIVIAIKRRM